jgi:hypothetical protein
MNPHWPIFIPSKGRWESRMTVRALNAMHVPYRVIVEEQELDAYAQVMPRANLLTLPRRFQDEYDACCDLQPGQSKGSGPARNFAWHVAREEGAEWHWTVDDNIMGFLRMNRNRKVWVGDGTVLRCMEEFAARFSNVAMAGPHYENFVLRKAKYAPFVLNTRIYSCNLIRTAAPFRWRARYNEDTDLSLRMLKHGWCTVLFNAFLQKKHNATDRMKGGNSDELYKGGTLEKSRMLCQLHPDVSRLVWKFSRWHHTVDYSVFKHELKAAEGGSRAQGVDDHGMEVIKVKDGTTYATDWRNRVEEEE